MVSTVAEAVVVRAAQGAAAVCVVVLSSGVAERSCFISTVTSQSITEAGAVRCESASLLQLNEKITPISHIGEAY